MNNRERREHVLYQLERRREVLAEWAETGISNLPEGVRVPESLNQVRLWDEPSLGIFRLGSPSSCTTTHRVHGAVVRDIARLLGELVEQRAAPARARAAKRKRRMAALQTSLTGAANRYAVLSVELDQTKLRLRVAEQGFATCQGENSDLRTEVRELKAELARRSASGSVTPIDPLRRDPT